MNKGKTLRLAALMVLSLAVSSLHAGAAHAEAAASRPSVALKSLMAFYPGSVPISSDTIRIADGVDLTLPAGHDKNKPIDTTRDSKREATSATGRSGPVNITSSTSGVPLAGCSYYYVCLFSGSNYDGYKISFYTCTWKDLGVYSYPGGGHWNDKMSSWVNNQTSGTLAQLYNWNGSTEYIEVASSYAPLGISGTISYNNIVDGVDPC